MGKKGFWKCRHNDFKVGDYNMLFVIVFANLEASVTVVNLSSACEK